MTEQTRVFKEYYKPKNFKPIRRKDERYCFKCHSIKPVLEFDRPSMDFRYACKCKECFEKDKQNKVVYRK